MYLYEYMYKKKGITSFATRVALCRGGMLRDLPPLNSDLTAFFSGGLKVLVHEHKMVFPTKLVQ